LFLLTLGLIDTSLVFVVQGRKLAEATTRIDTASAHAVVSVVLAV
jgi:hypothetical protein